MKKKQKIILLVLAIAVVVIIGVLAWSRLTKPEVETGPVEGGGLPSETEGGEEIIEGTEGEEFSLIRLSDEEMEVFGFWENPDNGEIYYITTRGLVKSAKEGSDLEISTRSFSGINNVRSDSEGERVLVSFGDPRNPEWGLFDSGDGVWRPIPSYIKDAIWGERDEVIAIVATEDGESLVSFDITELQNGGEVEEVLIENFTLKDVEISFSSPDSVIISEKPASFYGSRVWKFNMDDKDLIQILSPTKGLVMNWDEGGTVFEFEYDGEDSWFNILDGDLTNVFPVPFTTFPSKCNGADDKIYCFVPVSSLENLELPDDYFKSKFYTSDSLYELDIESKELKQKVSADDFNINVDALDPKKIGGSIYFINKYDKGLYRLTIEG